MDMSTTSMDMSMSTATTSSAIPSSTSLLPYALSDPRCNSTSCATYLAGKKASQAAESWASQFLYGHWVTEAWCILLGLVGLWFWSQRLLAYRKRNSQNSEKESENTRPSIYQKFLAANRLWSYRRPSGKASSFLGSTKSYGILATIFVSFIFLTAMVFAQKPYYRLHRGYGSPALGVRAGLMSVALTPLIYALSGKVNIITMITGGALSHEKLNVFHRYTSYLCLFLAIVHTIPFIVAPLQDSKGGYALLKKQFAPQGLEAATEYSGIAPFAVLVFLATFSVPIIRKKFYELFVQSHILGAIFYLGLMFWHVGAERDSPKYLWASLGIWVFNIVARTLDRQKTENLRGAKTTIEELDDKMLKLRVFTTELQSWKPGQHVFLRFPMLGVLDNHPFTIASNPTGTYVSDKEGNTTMAPIMFLVRAHGGITKKLAKHAQVHRLSKPIKSYIDGPYGGLSERLEDSFDSIILIAGGSGISAMLAHLIYLSKRIGKNSGPAGLKTRVKEIRLLWSVKTKEALKWVEEELKEAVDSAPEGTVFVEYFITEEDSTSSSSVRSISGEESGNRADLEAGMVADEMAKEANVHTKRHDRGSGRFGRPNLGGIIQENVRFAKTCVLSCGPQGMNVDVSNAVAACQKKVMQGQVQEVALRTETFGW